MTTDDRHQTFTDDLEAAGYQVEPYRGRFYYHGPAVRIAKDELQDVIRATSLPLQWDQLGKGLVVYPQ